jgi:NADH:ubiquinone oxidoreductase subunit 5 (subunit L)/multisubunit Na+/H+ antiporter MnhA subunit
MSVNIVTILLIILPLAVCIGVIGLQVFLSKKKNKWLSLILPAICFLSSLLMFLDLNKISGINSSGMWISFIGPVHFVIANIPTVVLLAIYFVYRKKSKQSTELMKMNIQDLE